MDIHFVHLIFINVNADFPNYTHLTLNNTFQETASVLQIREFISNHPSPLNHTAFDRLLTTYLRETIITVALIPLNRAI